MERSSADLVADGGIRYIHSTINSGTREVVYDPENREANMSVIRDIRTHEIQMDDGYILCFP